MARSRKAGRSHSAVPTATWLMRAPPALSRSTAISTRSGVAGASRRGQILWSATLATASDSACSTDIASMKGGSPTALERWIVGSCVLRPVGQRHVEDLRPVRGERDLVGRRRMGAQPALVVPPQFLGGQPAHALDEAALDLAEVDRRVQRAAGLVQDVGALDDVFAGQRVDRRLPSRTRHRRNSRRGGPRPCRGPSGSSASCRSRPPKAGCAPYRPA